MRIVIEEAVKLLRDGESCVLATVVKTKGSTPQKPGAKLLVRRDGTAVGTLGGGCVEGDIWFLAKELLRKGGSPVYQDYLLNEDIAAHEGLVCGGTMTFFVEPLYSHSTFLPFGEAIIEAYRGGEPVALATVVRRSDRNEIAGSKLLMSPKGSSLGSLDDNVLENEAFEGARRVIQLGKNEYLTTSDNSDVFVEGYTTPPTLILMGGGHIGKAIAPVAKTLGFRIYVIDDRSQFANLERFPEADDVIVAEFAQGLEQVPVNANTFLVIATRGHQFDDVALEAAARTKAQYIGLVGSRRKTILIYQALTQRGIPLERLQAIYAPIGLDIGALTPEEIAISIMSEITMFRMGGFGRSMKLEGRYVNRAHDQGLQSQHSG